MNVKCVFVVVVFNLAFAKCQYFEDITIKIYRYEKPVTILKADTINNEENATDIIIEDESVPVLKSNTFRDLLKLKYIILHRNNINDIEHCAFYNLPSLRTINLNSNNIKQITKNVFANLTVGTISLKWNSISDLAWWSFYNLSELHTLDLSYNNIARLPAELFVKTQNLKILDLSWNKLQSNLGARSEYPYTYFEEPFWNIKRKERSIIDLSYNAIDYIEPSMFDGLTGIQQLLLNYNNITNIHKNTFKNFMFLDVIELEGNNLELLEDSILRTFRMANDISLANNPWKNGFVCKYEQWCHLYGKSNSIDANCTVAK